MNDKDTTMLDKAQQILENKRAADELLQILKQEIVDLRQENKNHIRVIDLLVSRLEENDRDVEISRGRRFMLK